MRLKLYFSPGACSFVPHVLLETSGVAYEPVMVKLHKGEQYGDDYKAINPRSQVPVLDVEGEMITQIPAICQYLDQAFPAARFLPTAPMARAKALETLAWMNNTVHPTFTHIFMPSKFSDQADVQAQVKAHAIPQYHRLIGELQDLVQRSQASGASWLGGATMGPLDAYALTLTRWGTMAGVNPQEVPDLWTFVQRVAAQPAVQRVIERERLQLNLYKAA
jgi:glutathione S-transferase